MNRIFSTCTAVLFTLLLLNTNLEGQENNDLDSMLSESIYVKLDDSTVLSGLMISRSDSILVLQTPYKKIEIPKIRIAKIWQLEIEELRSYPQYGGLMPTGFKTEVFEYRNDALLLNRVSIPIKGSFSVNAGGMYNPRLDHVFMYGMKYSIQRGRLGISPSITHLYTGNEDAFLLPYLSVSYGSLHSYFNIGSGYGFDISSRRPGSSNMYVNSFGGYWGFAKKFGLNYEGILTIEENANSLFSSLMLKCIFKNCRIGLGVFAPYFPQDKDLQFYPNLMFSYSKSEKRSRQYFNWN